MPNSPAYLLDTAILLHWVRGSKVAVTIDGQFQLRTSNFRPLICEVSLGEIEAFDGTAFKPLRDGKHLDVILLDPMTGWKLS